MYFLVCSLITFYCTFASAAQLDFPQKVLCHACLNTCGCLWVCSGVEHAENYLRSKKPALPRWQQPPPQYNDPYDTDTEDVPSRPNVIIKMRKLPKDAVNTVLKYGSVLSCCAGTATGCTVAAVTGSETVGFAIGAGLCSWIISALPPTVEILSLKDLRRRKAE